MTWRLKNKSAFLYTIFLGWSLVGCGLLSDQTAEPVPSPTAPLVSPTAEPTAEFVAYLNPDRGIALQYPAGWVIREEPVLQLASDAALFDATNGVRSGALLAITPAPIPADEQDLGQILFDLVTDQGDVRIIDGPTDLMISGQEAAALTVVSSDADGIEFSVYYTLVRSNGAAVLISGVTPDFSRYEGDIEAITRSVIISAPRPTPSPPTLTPVPVPPTEIPATPEEGVLQPTPEPSGTEEPVITELFQAAVPSNFVQYQTADGLYSIGYPPDWLIDDEHKEAILFASNELLLTDNAFVDGGATVWLYTHSSLSPVELDPVLMLERFITNYPIYEGFNIVTAPAPLLINGQNGATSRYEATFEGAPMIVDYYVVVRGSHMVFVVSLVTVESVDQLQPLTAGMVASLVVKE